jgi:hypothetical protein
MKLSAYIILFLSVFFLSACEKEIDFRGEVTAPHVVVNSFVTPDSIVMAHVSESRFFLASGYTFKNIEDADVSLFVDGVLIEKMVYQGNGIYSSGTKPGIGQAVRLEVKIQDKDVVSCETKIEPQTNVISLDTTMRNVGQSPIVRWDDNRFEEDTIGNYLIYECRFKLKIKDDVNTQSFYRLVVMTVSTNVLGDKQVDYYFTFDDIVSGKNNTSNVGPPTSLDNNEYNVFSDELFNGKEYPLSFYVTNNVARPLPGYESEYEFKYSSKKEVYVNIQQISKSYYLYLKSRSASSQGNNLFSEPIQIHNNVVGGIGILGAYTSQVFKLDL